MRQATKENTAIGEIVWVPIQGEFMKKEQIYIEYEVVIALKCKLKPEQQIVGSNEKPMPEYLEFNNEMAYKININ
jgi:hypothetical protein